MTEAETSELNRLLSDTKVTVKDLHADPYLLGWVTNQLRASMDSKRDYPPAKVLAGSRGLA